MVYDNTAIGMSLSLGKVIYAYIPGSPVWKSLDLFQMIYASIWTASDSHLSHDLEVDTDDICI